MFELQIHEFFPSSYSILIEEEKFTEIEYDKTSDEEEEFEEKENSFELIVKTEDELLPDPINRDYSLLNFFSPHVDITPWDGYWVLANTCVCPWKTLPPIDVDYPQVACNTPRLPRFIRAVFVIS